MNGLVNTIPIDVAGWINPYPVVFRREKGEHGAVVAPNIQDIITLFQPLLTGDILYHILQGGLHHDKLRLPGLN